MSTLTFDTLKFANRLKAAGVPANQAEAEADALSEVFEANLGELVTNKDIDAKLANLKFELLKWIIGLMVAQSGLLLAVLKFFPINS